MVRVTAATTNRPKIYDVLWGASGTPADNALVFSLARTSTTGTEGGPVTPEPLDPADVAALADVGAGDFTIEPTQGAILIDEPVNQRASYRWVAAPGSELVIAATALLGIASQVKSAGYTGSAETSVFHEE